MAYKLLNNVCRLTAVGTRSGESASAPVPHARGDQQLLGWSLSRLVLSLKALWEVQRFALSQQKQASLEEDPAAALSSRVGVISRETKGTSGDLQRKKRSDCIHDKA